MMMANSVYLSSVLYGSYGSYQGSYSVGNVRPNLDQQRQKQDEEALGGKIKVSKFEDYLKRG